MDIWFGQSISTMAHIQLMQGNAVGAQKTLEDYMDILKQIDAFLKESGQPMKESPMAEARYLLGTLYEENAERAGKLKKTDEAVSLYGKALGEYYNVFIRYGESEFGPKAGIKAEAIISILQDSYGKVVDIDMGKNKAQAAHQAFKMADNLFRNRDYQGAIAEYIKMLGTYPDTPQTVGALINLAQCYAHEKDMLMTKTTVGYLGERYYDSDQAAMGLLAVGKVFFDQQQQDAYTYVYEKYLDCFPKHDRASSILYTLAGLFKQNGDEARAANYYKRLKDEYPNDRYSIKAMSNLAWTEYANKNYALAIQGFLVYLPTVQPGHDRAKAQFCLADSYMKTDDYVEALKAFNTLIGWLKPNESLYNNSAEATAKNKDLYEKACFYRGYCCTKVKNPPSLVVPLRKKGLEFFQAFLDEFPNSELAPKAMALLGSIQLELNDFNQAVKTFNQLASTYPNSAEGESALFSLVKSSMEVGKLDIARNALKDMLDKKSSYKARDFAGVGQLMVNSEMYPETIQAYAEVIGSTDDRALLEPALYGTGRAYYEMKNYDEAIALFEELMERYPKSALFYDAKFVLGNAYRETGEQQKATDALSDVFKYAEDPVLINRANLILGKVQIEQGDPVAANASFQRVALLADPDNKLLLPVIEECILLSIPLSMEMERYKDVQDSCDQYEKLFPRGDKLDDIRNMRREAIRQAAMQG
ncbi:MAG: tetratricopeptide repeat protein [Kiritimatiellae bacterium]|nr:tetratricopeptide repeat protein [Kiritimatiellia bacterium]